MTNALLNLFGLYELDQTGKIKYSRSENVENVVGLNFFDEVASFNNVEEFRRRFCRFAGGFDTAEKFTFICQFDEHPLSVKVLLTQVSEREYDANDRLIIVDIRRI